MKKRIKEKPRDFKRLNYFQRSKLSIQELCTYYADQRKLLFSKKKMRGITFRKHLHFVVKLILKIDQITSREKIVIIADQHNQRVSVPTIYACTHIGGNDIQRAFQVIGVPAYLMLGDPGILYRKAIYLGLKLNGVIALETSDREDRKIAYARAVELLKKSGNLLIYPEGAWNVSPNLLVMKIFEGAVRMAQETRAPIVPIAMQQYGNTFYINIGENYSIPKESNRNITEHNSELRSKLATLKWEIMELQPLLNRAQISKDYIDVFQKEIVSRCNYGYGFSLEDALRESFHDKKITNTEEAFAHLNIIVPTVQNSFLFNKRLKG